MNDSTSVTQDGALCASVQESPLRSTTPRSLFSENIDALYSALDGGDVAALQALAPGLTKAGARSVIYHHQQQAWRLDAGLRNYGKQTWGMTPPLRLLQGTLALRLGVLRAWHPELSAEEARRVVVVNIGNELAQGQFWRLPIPTYNASDEHTVRQLHQRRCFALKQELLAHYRSELTRIHAATVELLDEAGLSWELLASHAAGTCAQVGAVEQCAQSEAEDLRIFSAYLPESLRG